MSQIKQNQNNSENSSKEDEKTVSTRILIGLIIGGLIGLIFNVYFHDAPWTHWIMKNITAPLGQAFLQSLFMVVVPLVLSSLIVGVANLGTVEHLGRLGTRLGIFYVSTTLMAVFIGQFYITTIQPGTGIAENTRQEAIHAMSDQISGLQQKSQGVKESLWPGIVGKIIPKNIIEELSQANMLAIIFVSFIFGIALLTNEDKASTQVVLTFLNAISEACIKIVGWIMHLAPYAVAALMINAVANFGLEVMGNVGLYIAVVILGYLTQFFVTYSLLVKYLIRIPVFEFYKRIFPIIATAFSTSSSSATMPTTMRTLEKRFGVPESITTFSIPLGMTVNMDGTALFEVVAALFVAQVFGIDISLTGQFTLVILILLTSIGVAGVPGGSIPILMSAMASLGIPPEGIALVLGVDRLLDMGRTVVNVTGDATGALYLARVEKVDLNGNLDRIQ
ncbi:MAG: dicarboxylate/amino acid:cation symporter [Bdellovibrionales bacterium]|nr:dicarboxylate/amino acid:cation symporter [Bdellovibrionales bacterium]